MITTAVCVVRPPNVDFEARSEGIGVLARATRSVFARVFQRREKEADVKRDVVAQDSMLARHYSGCGADAQAAAHGWKEGLLDVRLRLRDRLAQLEARPGEGLAEARDAAQERGRNTEGGDAPGPGREGTAGPAEALLRGPGSVAERPAWRVAQAPGRQRSVCR